MRISFEIFSIPEENVDEMKREISTACGKYLYDIKADHVTASLKIQEGTCPLTGKRYLNVTIDGFPAMELQKLNAFQEQIFSVHPLKNESVVQENKSVTIEDTCAEDLGSGAGEDGELECWVCGRVHGEKRFDYDANEYSIVEVNFYEDGPDVPMCSICMNLFTNHDIWKQ